MPSSPPMGQDHPLGAASKELPLGAVLDSFWDYDTGKTVVTLIGKFPGKPDSDLYGLCKYSIGGYGTGSRMSNYSLKTGTGSK